MLLGVPEMSPAPLLLRFVTFVVLFLDQAYVVVAFRLLLVLNAMVEILASEHTVWVDNVATPKASGFTETVAVNAFPAQPSVVGIMVYVTNWVVDVTLFKEPVMSPAPLFAPVTFEVLSLLQA